MLRSIGKQSGNPGIKAVPIFRDLSISNKMVNIPKCSRNLTGNPRESQSATPSYKKKQRKIIRQNRVHQNSSRKTSIVHM